MAKEAKMDELQLEFEVAYNSWYQQSSGYVGGYIGWSFRCLVYVNNEPFLQDYEFDIWDIESTYAKSCEYELFTCSCGFAPCAGIYTKPKIIVSENTVSWQIFEPREYVLRFDKAQYIAEIKELKRKMLDFYTMKQWAKIPYLDSSKMSKMPFLKSGLGKARKEKSE